MDLALPPSNVPGSPGAAAWNDLVEGAVQQRLRGLRTAEHALASGELDLGSLCSYAAGAANEAARRSVEGFLARTPWALGRVTALVRGARGDEHGGLGKKLLEAAREGTPDAARVVGLAVLEACSHEAGRAIVEAGDAAAAASLDAPHEARGACLLGLGDRAGAQAAFAAAPRTPLIELAERVAREDDPESALLEVVQFV